jgi:Family of unknown function (DUF6522)
MTIDRPTAETEPSRATQGGAAISKGTIDRIGSDFIVDAALIGALLAVPAGKVPALMRSGRITSICESGVGADQGTFRLNFFHRGRQARVRIDASGHILQRSVIDFGERPIPRRHRRPLQASPRTTSR